MQVFTMKLHTGKDFVPVKVAKTLVKTFEVYADGVLIKKVENNFRRLVKLDLGVTAKKIEIKWLETNGDEKVRLYSVDFN